MDSPSRTPKAPRPARTLKVTLDANIRLGLDTLHPLPPELVGLLRSIRQLGSLFEAKRENRISVRNATALLARWEAITGHRLISTRRGRGTGLTPFAVRLTEVSDWLDSQLAQRFDGLSEELARYLALPDTAEPPRVRMCASSDVAILKLKERLNRHFTLDLRISGSLTSLDSLARGECEIAGFHLPSPPTLLGPLLNEFANRLSSRSHHVVLLMSRHQGLMLGKGIRRRVRGMADMARLGLQIVNRERGSGTRLLLDALLVQEGVLPSQIKGYDHEEFTHMATAATVRAGKADAAFGIEAAARAHDLRFVPMVRENYYLACGREAAARVTVDTMIATARSPAFVRALGRIGGYETDLTGTQVSLTDLFRPHPDGE